METKNMQESYKRLMKRKAILEEQLSEITISLNGMQVPLLLPLMLIQLLLFAIFYFYIL
ncbi:hypothetical protein QJS04_geneDACA022478 [Acorus gramineus]|uniref:Uncharacterized protein n=1 Tax=Acorus gramineus TaxID=55184 RepID=A0AAV9BGT2_ACOGR|nr:hypothetical protein QJS04_geneDACA022478 [Acorus gramineus]